MAPVKISHVVSFSSQDPKYPVENLLNPDSHKGPWLSCPRDKTGQLKVEFQLERAVPISYIDVGVLGGTQLHEALIFWETENAPAVPFRVSRGFDLSRPGIRIDVGRSSWPLDRPFVTLLPATMLMSLTDSREGKNRSGVRMFKDDDFLTPASGESWDRLRLTCSQPFTRHQSFGLAFLRVRSSLDSLTDPVKDPSTPGSSGLNQNSSDTLESGPSPWLTNPSIRRTFFPDPQTSTKEISELKGMLKQLQPGPLGRAARMVLSAARKAPPASVVSPNNSHGKPGSSHPERAEPRAEEPNRKNSASRGKRRKVQERRPLSNSSSQPNRRATGRTRQRQHRPQAKSDGGGVQATGQCPICTGSFSIEALPRHAATCGESSSPQPASPTSSSSSESVLWVSSPESSPPPPSWVQCPICELQFSAREIEEHASMCGEVFPV